MDKEVFMKNKKKIIIVVAAIAVSLIGFSLLNSTYSLFYHEETSKNTEGYSTGTLSITASSKGSTISLSDALPVEDSVGSTSTPYTFTITNTGNLNYKFNIKLLSTGSSSTTIGSQYIKLKVDDGSIATLSSLSNGIIKKDVTLAAGESIDISVRVWLSISTPNSQIGKTLNSKIVIDGQAVYTKQQSTAANDTLKRLNQLNSSIVLATDTPDFSTVSGNNGEDDDGNTGLGDGTEGIYKATDDLGISYYFRGSVENNYVKFANFYWRIIRINGDGTIRMIYSGTEAIKNGLSETTVNTRIIGSSSYNDNYEDNTYAGYMTGIAGASTYEETHSNIADSNIKTFVDNWYANNIKDTPYEHYIADSIYCNDRSVVNDEDSNNYFENYVGDTNTATGIGTDSTMYSSMKRLEIDYLPSLKCPNNNDKFTVESDLGNGKLTYPIGLITADELTFGGLLISSFNDSHPMIYDYDNYLDINGSYWSMTPYFSLGSQINAIFVNTDPLSSELLYNDFGVRPVISLVSDAITSGTGTMDDPFTVG